MTTHVQHQKNIKVDDANSPQTSIGEILRSAMEEKRRKQFVNSQVNALLSLYRIDGHDNCLVPYFISNLVSYFVTNEPTIKNNKQAIEAWVISELDERGECDIEVLNNRFKTLLSCIDPTVDLFNY